MQVVIKAERLPQINESAVEGAALAGAWAGSRGLQKPGCYAVLLLDPTQVKNLGSDLKRGASTKGSRLVAFLELEEATEGEWSMVTTLGLVRRDSVTPWPATPALWKKYR